MGSMLSALRTQSGALTSTPTCMSQEMKSWEPAYLPQHHDNAVRVQETRGVPLVQSHVCLHGPPPGPTGQSLSLRLGAGTLEATLGGGGLKGLYVRFKRAVISV